VPGNLAAPVLAQASPCGDWLNGRSRRATTSDPRLRRRLEEQSHELVRFRASFTAATRVLVPSFSKQPVSLPEEDSAFVPSQPILPAMIGGAPSSVGVEECWPHGPEVPQFPRLADRDSAQLHEEVT